MSMDFPDSPFPFVLIIHRIRQMLYTTSCVRAEVLDKFLLVVQHLLVRMKEIIAHKFILNPPVVSRKSCSSDLKGFRDGR